MIHSLKFALELHERCRTSEMLVSGDVFQEVLTRARRENGWVRILLNCHYDSPRYRFIHQAHWNGVRFIHLSNEAMEQERSGLLYAPPGR